MGISKLNSSFASTKSVTQFQFNLLEACRPKDYFLSK